MLTKKLWQYFVYITFGCCILCLSFWQIKSGPGPPSAPPSPYVISITANSSPFTYPASKLTSTDYARLMNITDFHFNILSNACNESSPLLLILVHSAPDNDEKRMTIRETWGKNTENVRIMFLLGKVFNKTLQMQIDRENNKHEDLVQGNFLDSYRNMTYKHVMAFKYAIYHCPQVKYILKTDDDIFINMPKMMDIVNTVLSPNGTSNMLLCNLVKDARVKRSYRSKWRVSFYEYPYRRYPNYCPGWALLYSPDVIFNLYEEAQRSKYFWIDDVLITGILAQKINLKITDITPLILSPHETNSIINGKVEVNNSFLYANPDLKENEIRALWKYINR